MEKAHHKQKDFCFKRPSYREARWERAVKVYTINQESRYLLVQGVPSVGASRELVERFALYGEIEEYRLLGEYPCEEFTEVYWIKYKRLVSARFGKKKLDNNRFFGGLLHVCYAPEYETVDDTRQKIYERCRVIRRKCREYEKDKTVQALGVSSSRGCLEKEKATEKLKPVVNTQQPDNHLVTTTSSNPSVLKTPSVTTTVIVDPTLPKVPTKNATLPTELQNLSASEVYPAYFEDIASSSKQFSEHVELSKIQIDTLNKCTDNDKIDTGVSSSQIVNRKKVINWTKPLSNLSSHGQKLEYGVESVRQKHAVDVKSSSQKNDSDVKAMWPITDGASHCYSREPGAWDPFREVRKRNIAVAEKDELETTVNTIRQKLSNSAEPIQRESSTSSCPLQSASNTAHLMVPNVLAKKRKHDGRKRI